MILIFPLEDLSFSILISITLRYSIPLPEFSFFDAYFRSLEQESRIPGVCVFAVPAGNQLSNISSRCMSYLPGKDHKFLIMSTNLHQNRQNAIAYYKTAFEGDPRKAVELYVGNEYTQHNPAVANGTEAFIDYFERMAREYPGKTIEFVRSVAEDDLVALHTHQVWPGGDEYVTIDFFRFDDDGKIVEHWDAVQEIPDESVNGNTMY